MDGVVELALSAAQVEDAADPIQADLTESVESVGSVGSVSVPSSIIPSFHHSTIPAARTDRHSPLTSANMALRVAES